jgi:hypothetical protein
MNTLGKILVVLNFVFALVVGAFLTLKFATETNWKAGVEKLSAELDIARKDNQVFRDEVGGLRAQLSDAKAKEEERKQDLALFQAQFAIREAELLNAFKEAESRAKNANVNYTINSEAMGRMKKEVEALKTSVENREDLLVKVHAKFKDNQELAMTLERDLKFSQDRNQGLLGRVQELERHVAEIVSGAKAETASALAKDPWAPNPPAKNVKGTIERVDSKDSSLVSVSLGTDHGVKNGHTLEVYRLQPAPEYVGMIKIEDAHAHNSVARLIRVPGVQPKMVLQGDVVGSSLLSR